MKIKKEELAEYISRAFDNEYIKLLTQDSKSRAELLEQLTNLSRFIFAYVTSTGDLSQESLNTILYDFVIHKNEPLSLDKYFGNYIFPLIENKYKKDHGIEGPLSLIDYNNIYKEMSVNSNSNKFFTHSFSGALFNDISEKGLDAKSEKFKDEFRFLSYFGFKTPYARGKLHITELSYQTMGYALQPSEMARMVLTSHTDLKEEDSETSLEYYHRVIENLELKNCDEENLETIKDYLTDISNFYFSNDKSCIAVIEGDNKREYDDSISPFIDTFYNRYEYQKLLESDETFRTMYEKTDTALRNYGDKGVEILEIFANYMHTKYQGSRETAILDQTIKDMFLKNVTTFAIKHFEVANGEGYVVESGHISPDKFAIATIPNPLIYYPEHKKGPKIEIESIIERQKESEEKGLSK